MIKKLDMIHKLDYGLILNSEILINHNNKYTILCNKNFLSA